MDLPPPASNAPPAPVSPGAGSIASGITPVRYGAPPPGSSRVTARGPVLPAPSEVVTLVAEFHDGRVLSGETAIAAARTQVAELYGVRFVPPEPRRYTRKVKNAQEAHEAIRPAGDQFRTPGEVARELSTEEFKLYELIWRRTIAIAFTRRRTSPSGPPAHAASND